MSSGQNPSLLYTIVMLIIGALIGAAVSQHVYPKIVNFFGPIIRRNILAIWSCCIDGKKSIRQEWKERGRAEKWETITTGQGDWEWDRKSSSQNMRCHGISFSSLKTFVPMCEANLIFEPRTSYSPAELEEGNIALALPPNVNIEICGRIGENICIVSGKKESNERIIVKSVKTTTLTELNQLRKNITAKHESEYKAIKRSMQTLSTLASTSSRHFRR